MLVTFIYRAANFSEGEEEALQDAEKEVCRWTSVTSLCLLKGFKPDCCEFVSFTQEFLIQKYKYRYQ